MARQISLDEREWIEIVNSKKEVTGGFWWNPADMDIVKRCEKTIENFNNLEVTGKDENALFRTAEYIKEQFDYLISPGASEELFKHCNPLSPREDGTLYCEYVLDILVNFIESEMNTRVKRTTDRIEKYTKKYT